MKKKPFLIKVREKYFEAFERLKEAENVIIVDGNRGEQEIAEDIWEKTKAFVL